jgi:hypothetical protein
MDAEPWVFLLVLWMRDIVLIVVSWSRPSFTSNADWAHVYNTEHSSFEMTRQKQVDGLSRHLGHFFKQQGDISIPPQGDRGEGR